MGTMPYHLEKGVLGLRMDYLTRSPAVRAHVLQRLQAGEDPFVVAGDINIPGVPTINVFINLKADFAARLDALLNADPDPPDSDHERRSGTRYLEDQRNLMPRNDDRTANRNRFEQFWRGHQNGSLTDQMRDVLVSALSSGREHIDYWWECGLPEGSPPQVLLFETDGAAHVFFSTDHRPVEPINTAITDPEDPPVAT
jgi:hypothetical protein